MATFHIGQSVTTVEDFPILIDGVHTILPAGTTIIIRDIDDSGRQIRVDLHPAQVSGEVAALLDGYDGRVTLPVSLLVAAKRKR